MASSFDDTKECGRLEGRYANYFKIGHNAYEFVIDFGQYYEVGVDLESIHSRIITSPTYVKSLIETLNDAIDQYENSYGKIEPD